MKYIVHFRGRGFTAPNEDNPNGIKVDAKGHIVVEGPRPESGFKIPWDEIKRCKRVFMEQCQCVRYQGDRPGHECYPTVWLGKQLS